MPSTIELDQSDPVVGRVADTVLCVNADELLADDLRQLVEAVRDACTQTGFFFVDVTSSRRESLAATLDQMQRFFALDDSDPRKRESEQTERDYGWVPKYSEPAYQPGTVSSLEAFDFGLEDVDDPGSGIWPPLPGFRAACLRCWNDYVALADALLEVIAQAAGMDPDFLVESCNSRELNTMRLLNYAGDPVDKAGEDVGISAHTDFECITLLYQTAPGLELLDVNGKWLDAPTGEGRIIVLLDDMLERWSNGAFKATGHRVRRTNEQRFSIVLFVAVNDGVEIAPLPQFASQSTAGRYTPITQAEHIDNEIERAEQNAAAAAAARE